MRRTLGFAILLLTVVVWSCKKAPEKTIQQDKSYVTLMGKTMGTYYRIQCNCPSVDQLQQKVENRLAEINQDASTYMPESYISKVNQATAPATFTDMPPHFKTNLLRANHWYEQSEGYFDVSVQPLVNYWGFGYTPKHAITDNDAAEISKIKSYTGLNKWGISSDTLQKNITGQQLGFAALAKGYAVDQVGSVLAEAGCSDYYVDIGGEQVLKGQSHRGDPWTVGISTPTYDADLTDTELIIQLTDKALASSGNYRNYHEANGRKYGHTIDPTTGYPFQDSLLSVSIIADNCMDADAIATTCMAMGYAKAATFISRTKNVSACFLVGDNKGRIVKKYKNGFIRYVVREGQ